MSDASLESISFLASGYFYVSVEKEVCKEEKSGDQRNSGRDEEKEKLKMKGWLQKTCNSTIKM